MTSTRELFNRHSLRCTTQRMALYEALASENSHPTAEELFRRVKPATAKLSLATVYNTLEALCRAGLARKLPTTNGSCRYDSVTTSHPHVRYRRSGRIDDLPRHLAERLLKSVPQEVLGDIERELAVQIAGLNIQVIANDDPVGKP